MNLYLARHCETQANIDGLYCGWTDLPLATLGQQQAVELSKLLSSLQFDLIVTSGLQRTIQTAALIAEQSAAPRVAYPELNEINFGDWELHHYTDLCKNHSERFRYWGDNWQTAVLPNGESLVNVQQRAYPKIDEILSYNLPNVLVVGHLGILKLFMLRALNLDIESYWQFDFNQGDYSLLKIRNRIAIEYTMNLASVTN